MTTELTWKPEIVIVFHFTKWNGLGLKCSIPEWNDNSDWLTVEVGLSEESTSIWQTEALIYIWSALH